MRNGKSKKMLNLSYLTQYPGGSKIKLFSAPRQFVSVRYINWLAEKRDLLLLGAFAFSVVLLRYWERSFRLTRSVRLCRSVGLSVIIS